MHAHVINGVVITVGSPPDLGYKDGRWWPLRDSVGGLLALLGWFPVIEAPKPADTPTTVWEPVFTVDGSKVTQSWVEVPKTAEQLEAEREDTNQRTLTEMLAQDFADLQVILADTNANINNNPAARIKTGFRVLRRLVRVANGDFSGTD